MHLSEKERERDFVCLEAWGEKKEAGIIVHGYRLMELFLLGMLV